MFSSVIAGAVYGIEPYLMRVETDISGGLPSFSMVGFLGREVRESGDRVRAALRNSGFPLPVGRLTVSFTPADIPKRGIVTDLPVAVGILAAMEILDASETEDVLIAGELGLDGEVRPVKGMLPIVRRAAEEGLKTVILPEKNAAEGAVIRGIKVVGVRSLKQCVRYLMAPLRDRDRVIAPAEYDEGAREQDGKLPDFSEVRGQTAAKRALEIAAAGFHNALMIGPPGSGKSMLASRLPGILPPLSKEEQLEVTSIYSIAGKLGESAGLMRRRPFVAPHHSVTAAALTGGGAVPKPGLITLSNRGVLFLDELPEFGRETLDLLRQPMEDHTINVSRVGGSFVYPARCIVLAAMNPCPCGFYPDRNRCRCTDPQVRHYLSRVSGPILDRMDLCVEVPQTRVDELTGGREGESSSRILERVMRARALQESRFAGTGISFNADMSGPDVEKYCLLGAEESGFMEKMYRRMNLSARSYHRMLKVARTIADLEGEEQISCDHLAEAAGYRVADRKFWK